MTDQERLSTWIDHYVRAWNSNDETQIAALFTADAEYFTDPYTPPWSGRDVIVSEWLEHRDAPGETTFTWEPLVVGTDLSIITAETSYPAVSYSNLWVIKLDAEGRCSHFTEWWMAHPPSAKAD